MTDKILIDRAVVEQALEALKAAVSDDQPYIVKSKEAVATLRAALEQQVEQGLVAWIYQNSNTDKEYLVWCKSEMGGRNWQPLYLNPQPPRRPLTDKQINDHRLALPYDGEDLPDPWDFTQGVRVAERAHGIGGEA